MRILNNILTYEGLDVYERRMASKILIHAGLLCLCGMISFSTPGLVGPVSILACLLLFYTRKEGTLVCMLPPLILYYEFLVLPGGLSVFRVFTLLFLAHLSKNSRFGTQLYRRETTYFLVAFFYSIIVIAGETGDFRKVIFLMLDIYVFIKYIHELRSSQFLFTMFASTLIIAVCCSGLSSLTGNVAEETMVVVDGEYQQVNRLLGTFTDSNYFSIYINAAIFCGIAITSLPKFFSIGSLLILYYCLFATSSMTGLMANILGVGIIMYLKNQIKFSYLVFVAIIVIGAYFFLLFVASNYETSFINSFMVRLQSKMQIGDDMNDLTSNRTDLWKEHWDFYLNKQGLLSQIIGGNRMNAISTTQALSHQDFVDILLCVGVLGFLLLVIPNVTHSISLVKNALKERNDQLVCMVMFKYLYFFYAFGLTMFLDYKFFLFMLL